MSKALVIKGANFSVNKIETVTLSNPVPCTGITLTQSSMSATSLGIIGTLTTTLTPVDTTDQVTWTSSDDTVATVTNGVVKAVGLGSATITAHCGNQSATCSVSVSTITFSATDLVKFTHYQLSTSKADFESGRDYTGVTSSASTLVTIASQDQTESGYRAFSGDNASYEGAYPIVIPKNTAKITFASPSTALSGVSMCYMDSTQQPAQISENKGTKVVLIPSTSWGGSPRNVVVPTDPSELDSFVAVITFKSGVEALPNDFSISFSEA